MLGTFLLVAYWPKCCAARPVPLNSSSSSLLQLVNSSASQENSIFVNSNVANESEELFFVFSIKKRKDGTVFVKDILKLNVGETDGDDNNKNDMQKIMFKPDEVTFNRNEKADNCSSQKSSGLFTINSNSSTNLEDIVNLTLQRPELKLLIDNDQDTSTSQSQLIRPTLISNSGVISSNVIDTNSDFPQTLSRRDRNIFVYNNSSNKINNNNLLLKHIKSKNNNKVKSLNLDRNERSANLSHITGTARKIQLYIKNRFLQLLPDGTVNGTTNELSDYSEYFLILKLT
jgi:hypothetical protein